jgi:hypothetical protein
MEFSLPQSNLLLAHGSRAVCGIARADRLIVGDLGRVLD